PLNPKRFANIGKALKDYAFQKLISQFISEPTTSEPSSSHIPETPHVTNPELAKICNNILNRMKSLHQLRIQNEYFNELVEFQLNTRELVKGVNKEFETSQLKKKGRLSIPANFFDDTVVTNQVWKV
ncbi:hypothetical protein A2U01_0041953, partial [Trifolium medium]|nr:hypothetical protein [Trifolium medium]